MVFTLQFNEESIILTISPTIKIVIAIDGYHLGEIYVRRMLGMKIRLKFTLFINFCKKN
jgi:hypothetical protein